jgi:hypothetical protein
MLFLNRHRFIKLTLLLCLILALAACETELPTPPQITVVITAVDNQTLLDSAVEEALTGTAVAASQMTETALAQGNITLTPSATPTATITPLPPTATPIITPSTTPTPTETSTPTFAPYLPNTPVPQTESESATPGRIRILHAWRARESMPVDVFIDQVAVARSLDTGNATGYQQVNTDAVRVALQIPARELDANSDPVSPLISQVVQVPAGGSVSVVIGDIGEGLALLPIVEDIAPLASGKTRVNIVHMNPDLLRSNLILPHMERSLAHNFALGHITGAFDLDSGTYDVEVRDADLPDQTLTYLSRVRVDSQVNYLMVLLPSADAPAQQQLTDSGIFTDYLLFPGSTRRTASDTAVHFVNATTSGVQILFDNQLQVQGLATGGVTTALPFPVAGGTVRILNLEGRQLYDGPLGPWPSAEQAADKIVMITDVAVVLPGDDSVQLTTFLQNPLPAPLRSTLRLIHGLTGTTATLDLEIQSTNPVVIENEFGVPVSEQEDALWSPIIRGVSFGAASDFVVRTPNIFNIRLVLSGTQSVQASLEEVQLIAGGVYDLIALPAGVGVSRLILLQPDVQTSTIGLTGLDPVLIETQVAATVTALAPTTAPEDETPIPSITPTATISPVPTNTPRPSNTPTVPIPSLVVEPAPPNAVSGAFLLRGEGFAPSVTFTLSLNEGGELQRGTIGPDGTLAVIVDLPSTLGAGLHTVRVCADCRPSGRQQEAFTLFRVANPQVTATATP